MSVKQLTLFRRSVERTPTKPKHPKTTRAGKYGAAITDYGTLREWDRPLTPCERRRYLTPFPSGRTYATFYQIKTTGFGWLGRHYEQGSTTMHIRLFRRNGA